MRRALSAAWVLATLVFLPVLFEGWEAPKAAVVRVAGLGLGAAALALPRGARALRWHALDVALAAWLGVEIVATIFSVAPWVSVFGDPQQHEGLLTSVSLAGLYLAARVALPREQDVRGALDLWVAAACVSSGYAFLQIAHLDPFSWVHMPTLGTFVRPGGTLGHANLLGVVTAAACAAAFPGTLSARRGRAVRALALAVLALATVLTFSRAAWLALAAGATASGALAWAAGRRTPISRRAVLVAAGVAILVVVALALSPLRGLVIERVRGLASPFGGSGSARLDIWRAAWAMWHRRPLVGEGPDTFGILFTQFQPATFWNLEWNHVAWHAHSIYLHALVTRGVLGFVAGALGAAGLGTALVGAWRRGGRGREAVGALSGALIALAVTGSVGALGIAGAAALAVMAAAAANLASAPEAREPGPKPARAAKGDRRARGAATGRRAWAVGLAAATVAVAVSACDLGALSAAGEARGWVDRGGLAGGMGGEAEAAELAAQAAAWQGRAPWDDLLPRTAGELLMTWAAGSSRSLELLRQAEGASREAVRRVPLRATNHRRLADALGGQAMLGDSSRMAAAEASFSTAATLAPCDAFILLEWARARLATGNPRGALEPARHAVALYPDRGFALEVLGEAEAAVGDSSAARAAFHRALAARWDEEPAARERAARRLEALAPGR